MPIKAGVNDLAADEKPEAMLLAASAQAPTRQSGGRAEGSRRDHRAVPRFPFGERSALHPFADGSILTDDPTLIKEVDDYLAKNPGFGEERTVDAAESGNLFQKEGLRERRSALRFAGRRFAGGLVQGRGAVQTRLELHADRGIGRKRSRRTQISSRATSTTSSSRKRWPSGRRLTNRRRISPMPLKDCVRS